MLDEFRNQIDKATAQSQLQVGPPFLLQALYELINAKNDEAAQHDDFAEELARTTTDYQQIVISRQDELQEKMKRLESQLESSLAEVAH